MSKKTVLKEGTIRRFMKLADIEPLSEHFLADVLEEEAEEETEEEAEEELAEEADLEASEEELPAEELPAEEPPPEANAEVEQRLAAGIEALMSAAGVEGSVETGAEEAELPPEEEPELEDLGAEADLPAEEEPVEEDMMDRIAEVVAKRVASRLEEEKKSADKKQEIVNTLTENIMNRIFSKKNK